MNPPPGIILGIAGGLLIGYTAGRYDGFHAAYRKIRSNNTNGGD